MAATASYVARSDNDIEVSLDSAMQVLGNLWPLRLQCPGVIVQAPSHDFLKALLQSLMSPEVNIPVSSVDVGPVRKRNVMNASFMVDGRKEYATILALNVEVTPEACELAKETGVKILMGNDIDTLFIQFKNHVDYLEEEKAAVEEEAIFPCVLQIRPNCILNKKDPIVLGVVVVEGIAKVGTPICIPSRDFIDIGKIGQMKINEMCEVAEKGTEVLIKLAGTNPKEEQMMFGRDFSEGDELVSHISKRSVELLEANYQDKLSVEEWSLVGKLKCLLGIQ